MIFELYTELLNKKNTFINQKCVLHYKPNL